MSETKKRIFKRTAAAFLALCLLLVAGCSTSPEESAAVLAVQNRGIIRIGVYGGVPGFSTQEGGTYTGLEADLARAVGTYIIGSESMVELVEVDEFSRLHKLGDGSIDLAICMLSYTENYEASYAASSPYFTDNYAFMVKNGTINSLGELNGKRVGVLYGSGVDSALETFASETGLTIEIVDVASYPEGKEMLNRETPKIDALCAPQGLLEPHLDDTVSLLSEGFGECAYSIFSLKSKEGLAQLAERKLEEMRSSGELDTLLTTYGF